MSPNIEKYNYSYMKSIKSQFIKTNSVHDKGNILLDHIMGSIMIICHCDCIKISSNLYDNGLL